MLLRIILKKTITTVLLVILAIATVFFSNGAVEHVVVNKIVKDFRARGEYLETVGNISYYRVPLKYDYEDIDDRFVFDYTQGYPFIGAKGDIILTNRNPMQRDPLLAVPIGFLAKNFYIGHATLNGDDEGEILIEAVGNATSNNGVRYYVPNDWFYQGDDTPSIVALRVKNTTQEQIDKAIEYAEEQIGLPYNFTFLFNRKHSFYCTDLVTRSYAYAGIKINYDFIATTGNDLIMSKNTYLIFHRHLVIESGQVHYHVYFLDQGETNNE